MTVILKENEIEKLWNFIRKPPSVALPDFNSFMNTGEWERVNNNKIRNRKYNYIEIAPQSINAAIDSRERFFNLRAHKIYYFFIKALGVESHFIDFCKIMEGCDPSHTFNFKEAILKFPHFQKTNDPALGLFYIIQMLNDTNNKSLLLVIDDVHIIFQVVPSLISFIQRGGKFKLIYKLNNGFNLCSAQMHFLFKIGVEIQFVNWKLPLKMYGLFANFDCEPFSLDNFNALTIKPKLFLYSTHNKIFIYTNNEADKKDAKLQYDDLIKIVKYMRDQIFYKADGNLNLDSIPLGEYVAFFKQICEDLEEHSVYKSGCLFTDEELVIDELYSRQLDFKKHKLLQAYHTFEHQNVIDNKDIYISKIINIQMGNGRLYPINPIIVEKNGTSYEIAEGHHRVFVLSKVLKVKRIRTLVIDITNQENLKTKVTKEDGTNKYELIKFRDINENNIKTDIEREENIYKVERRIESMTHIFTHHDWSVFQSNLIALGILDAIEAESFISRMRSYLPSKWSN